MKYLDKSLHFSERLVLYNLIVILTNNWVATEEGQHLANVVSVRQKPSTHSAISAAN